MEYEHPGILLWGNTTQTALLPAPALPSEGVQRGLQGAWEGSLEHRGVLHPLGH